MDSTSSRRLTRSQTSTTVLGKRTPGLLRTSSMSSINSAASRNTSESTPTKKRARTTHEKYDPRANKENIPPNDLFQPPSFITHLLTPPPTPPIATPLHVRVRTQLRATSNSGILMSMEGREGERAVIETFLHSFDSVAETSYSILYISGGPGTGKTALVNSMIASSRLNSDVKIILINCMAITGMDALWARIADELSGVVSKGKGRRAGKKLQGKDEVYAVLEKRNNLKCILVLDELDNLAGACSNALQPLVGLASAFSSSVRIMGIANTHTLTLGSNVSPLLSEELGSSKPSSPTSNAKPTNIKTIHFAPYTPDELLSILERRLEEFDQDEVKQLLPRQTLVLLTKKVAALTGDVRVLFEVLRGAIDLAIPAASDSSSVQSLPMVEDISRTSVSPSHILSSLKSHAPASTPKDKSVTSANKRCISSASSNSETVSKVRNLGLQARFAILALVLASKRVAVNLSLSSNVPSTPTKRPPSPSKRSPLKHSASSSPVRAQSNAPAATAGIDSSALFTYYTSLLASTETFSPVSRSDFTDLFGVLETTGLVSLAAVSTATSGNSVRRTASIPSMFARAKAGAQGAQRISLQAHVREGEVERGLGICAAADSATKSDEDVDVMGSEVRTIWTREMARMRREMKAKDKDALAALEGVLGFDDANEN